MDRCCCETFGKGGRCIAGSLIGPQCGFGGPCTIRPLQISGSAIRGSHPYARVLHSEPCSATYDDYHGENRQNPFLNAIGRNCGQSYPRSPIGGLTTNLQFSDCVTWPTRNDCPDHRSDQGQDVLHDPACPHDSARKHLDPGKDDLNLVYRRPEPFPGHAAGTLFSDRISGIPVVAPGLFALSRAAPRRNRQICQIRCLKEQSDLCRGREFEAVNGKPEQSGRKMSQEFEAGSDRTWAP